MCLVSQPCPILCNPIDCSPPGSSVHGDSPGKSTGLVCHALLQGIFPTQGSNPGILLCRRILYGLGFFTEPLGQPNGWLETTDNTIINITKMSDSKRGLKQRKIDGEKFQNPYFLQNKSQDLHNGLHLCCQLAHFTPLSSSPLPLCSRHWP